MVLEHDPGKSLPPDFIPGGRSRFAEKDTRRCNTLEHVPIPQERGVLQLRKEPSRLAGTGTARALPTRACARPGGYFFTCFCRNAIERCQATFDAGSLKLARSSQWKPCAASG